MICIQCIGGLGNRLFIYAFARALQLDSNEPIVMYHTWQNGVEYYTQALKEMIPPNVDITHVSVEQGKDIWDVAPIPLFFCRAMRKVWLLGHPNREAKDIEYALQPIWNKLGLCMITDGYLPFSRKSPLKKFVCKGYFQSRRFWGTHTEEIRSELYRPDLISKDSQEYLEQIQTTNAVCLHIRLGDYVNDPGIRNLFHVCDENYYLKAVETALAKLNNPTFFAFTNDQELANQIPFPKDAKIVWVPSGEAVNDLQLMGQCRHFIISNSSYSWWGQFLSAAPDKVVFAPDRWFRSDKPVDLYEEEWVRIPITPIGEDEVTCEN